MGALRTSARRGGAGYRLGGGLLLLVALSAAALIGSAHAAPSTKNYTATVHVTDATRSTNALNTFTVTLTNGPKSNQTFGSANVTPPPGFQVTAASTTRSGWTATVDAAGIIELRSTSNAVANGDNVVVSVTVDPAGISGCSSARWGVDVKQSNDFNGTNNGFTMQPTGSDLTALGGFVFSQIETVLPGEIHVPQILTGVAAQIRITALDTCGNPDSDYSGATLAPKADTPPRLVNATFSALTWATNAAGARVGSATLTPSDVEVQDNVVVLDPASQISATSPNPFDVVEKICAVAGTSCTWPNKNGTITATSTVAAGTAGQTPSLGLGFRPLNAQCTLTDGTVVSSFGDAVQIVPVGYGSNYVVTLTYSKATSGNGPASSFHICLNDQNGAADAWTPVPQCGKTPVAVCADPERISTGALQITLYLTPNDPLSGGYG